MSAVLSLAARGALALVAAPAIALPVLAADAERDNICCVGGCTGPQTDPVKAGIDADAELNRTYRAVLAEYADVPGAVEAIRDAQRSWIALRDRDLEAPGASWGAVLPEDDPGHAARCSTTT
ncbi:lysozyme inhibitor LprI family protein [Luteimonas sp. TWI1437]|uniref:lysozyme inhibitor LprI family protein n=1 Tax=unclassified Luteimonas TaxID=2629088 RepID=UPI003207EB4C